MTLNNREKFLYVALISKYIYKDEPMESFKFTEETCEILDIDFDTSVLDDCVDFEDLELPKIPSLMLVGNRK